MEKKKKVLIGLLIVLMTAITMISGCLGEDGQHIETFTIHIGEERQITGTNYSLILIDVFRGALRPADNSVFVEVYRDSEYVTGKIIVEDDGSGSTPEKDIIVIESFGILLDNIPTDESAKISIYLI